MDMGKDVTAFRERFNAYKNGKSVSEIYDAGLPRYGDGLAPTTTYSDDDALSYIIALENPNKVGWDSNKKVWRVPTGSGFDHNAIAYGLDIREKHNPYVYNFLKSKGRLNNPWLTDDEARALAMKSYHAKDNSVAKAMGIAKGKVSERGYLILRGMAWHGDPMKKLLDEDTVTGKAFRRAIAEGDADLDTVFDAYYLHPANAKKYAERIKADAKYRPKALFVTLDGKVLKIDWDKQVPKWLPPQLQTPHNTEYPIVNTAPESISSWSGADSPSKGPRILSILDTMQQLQNILNLFGLHPVTSSRSILPPLSKLMPSLDELMAEQQLDYVKDILNIENPVKDVLYHAKNGKLPGYKIGHNVSHADKKSDGSFTDDYTKVFEDMYVTPQKADLKLGSYTLNNFPYYLQHRTDWMKPFMSSGTNEKGLELIHPEFDLLLGGRLLATELMPNITRSKLASNISSAIGSPSLNPFKYKTNETAADLFTKMKKILIRGDLSKIKTDPIDMDNDPYGIRNLSSGVIHHEGMPSGVEDIFRHQILPRTNISKMNYENTIDMLSRYGYNTLDDYNWAKYVDNDLAGYLDNSTLAIALREPNIRYAAPHEFRHRMQHLVKDKPSLAIDRKSYLDRAYGDDFINLPNTVDESDHLFGYPHMADEAATTNLDSRIYAFSNFTDNPNIGKMSVADLNKFLDSLSDDLIIEAVANSNGYGRRYIHFLEQKYDMLNNLKTNAQWANRFRNAMKYYGSFALPAAIVASLPEYSNGKSPIHIKPANRGKFTALKKRTGHSASWFKENGTPAQKKMAVFALNAKKWKH